MKLQIDSYGRLCSFKIEIMLAQYIFQAQEIYIGSQGHLPHTVCVKIKLIIGDLKEVLEDQEV